MRGIFAREDTTMSTHTPAKPDPVTQARHELRSYLHNYGADLKRLLSTLGALHAGVVYDELWERHGHTLPAETVSRLVSRIVAGLEALPYHVTIDDGAFRPPYKNAALRAEAAWHRAALQALRDRLSSSDGG
jgi:hypothetical protein